MGQGCAAARRPRHRTGGVFLKISVGAGAAMEVRCGQEETRSVSRETLFTIRSAPARAPGPQNGRDACLSPAGQAAA